jgi:hypothetical protein
MNNVNNHKYGVHLGTVSAQQSYRLLSALQMKYGGHIYKFPEEWSLMHKDFLVHTKFDFDTDMTTVFAYSDKFDKKTLKMMAILALSEFFEKK